MGKSLKRFIHVLLIVILTFRVFISYEVMPVSIAIENHGWALSVGSSYSETMPYHVVLNNGDIALAGTHNDGTKNSIIFMIIDKNGIEKPNSKKVVSFSNSAVVRSVSKKPNGNIIVAGDVEKTISDYFVVELNSSGNVVSKVDALGNCINPFSIGGSNAEHLYTAIGTSDNGMLLGGFSYTFTSMGEYYLVKLDQNNKLEWSKYYFNHAGFYNSWVSGHPYHSIIETSDGGFLVGAHVYPGMNSDDYYLLKLDNLGNKQWGKMYGYNGADWTSSVAQAQDGGYIISGTSTNLGSGSWDVLTLKTDSTGNISWANTYGSASVVDWSVRTISTADGGIATLWNDFGYVNPAYLTKMDQNGQIEWINRLGNTFSKKMVCLSQGDSEDLVVSGHINLNNGNQEDFLLMCFDKNGRIYSDEDANSLSVHFSSNFPIQVIDQIGNVLHQNYNPVLNEAIFQPECMGYSQLDTSLISTSIITQNPDIPVDDDDDDDPEEYPILLVHGFQFAPYNPLDKMESLVKQFTGQPSINVFNTEAIPVNIDSNHYVYHVFALSENYRSVYVSDFGSILFDPYNPIQSLRLPTFDDIRFYAGKLKQEIDVIKQSENQDKLNIVAHSMGGLIARTYIEERAFDSEYAKRTYPLGSHRSFLPRFENDIHRLIMIGTPNHGTQAAKVWTNGAKVAQIALSAYSGTAIVTLVEQMASEKVKSKLFELLNSHLPFNIFGFNPLDHILQNLTCIGQMDTASSFIKILNYERDISWDVNRDDILNNGVYYHLIGGVIPHYLLTFATQASIDRHYIDLSEKLISDENRAYLFGESDGLVPVNSVRVYDEQRVSWQYGNLNHMYIHADHSQILRNPQSFEMLQKLLESPEEKIQSKEYWKSYGKGYSAGLFYRILGATMFSPAVLSIKANNQIVGFDFNNTTESAFVNHLDGSIQWFDPPSNIVSYRVEGYEEGTYGVRFTSLDFNDDKNEAFVFENHGLPTNIGQVDQIEIDWETHEAKMSIDYDGDGEFDDYVTAPSAPKPLIGTLNHNRVNLQWSGSEPGTRKIKGYRIYRASVKNEQFKAIGFVNASKNDEITSYSNNNSSYQFTDGTGTIGESYLYFINAEAEGGLNSVSSNIYQAGPLTLPPAPHLRISAELNKPTFSKDETAMVMVTVVNQGESVATNTHVKMTLPQELSFLRSTRYRSVVQTPALIEFELGAIAPNSVQTFQVDVKVLVAVSQLRSIPIHFDVNCTEKSFDFAHVLLQLVPQRSGRPDIYLGLYYRNAHWDPQTSSVFIPQDTPLEIDLILTGAQAPYELSIDWGDGEVVLLTQQTDLRQTLRHQFKSKGKKTITVKVTDQLQRSKTATLHMEVR
ncbi:MAG TPA: hypothetical protein PK581_08495 [Caldisericia bacterium]|nr:hypothetical protein [Caldisericia bacterium]